jgi:nucleoid DNA-binding protein
MTKQELSTKTGVAPDKLDRVFGVIGEALAKGQIVTIRGFGTFQTVVRAEKKARNISTGEQVVIPAHRVPALKFCKELKESVEAGA